MPNSRLTDWAAAKPAHYIGRNGFLIGIKMLSRAMF
jgi:hypothetical protein